MTREEINILQDIVDIYEKEDMYPLLKDREIRTLKLAIKALEQEQEPCDNTALERQTEKICQYRDEDGYCWTDEECKYQSNDEVFCQKQTELNELGQKIEPCDDAQERYEDLCEYFGDAKDILKSRKDFKAWLERIKWHIHKAEELYEKYEHKQKPCDDAVSRGVFEQVKWERDIAIEQLNELGYELGQKIEPYDDAISRQNIIDTYESCADMLSDEELEGANLVMEWVYKAPSVNSQEPKICEQCLYAEETDGSHCYECVKGESKFEQEPCDDVVSRQAVIGEFKDMYKAAERWSQDATEDDIKARADAVMATLIEQKLRVEALPSVRPQEQTGRWIKSRDSYGNYHFTCSKCGNDIATQYADNWEDKYCSECGAKMVEQKESEE